MTKQSHLSKKRKVGFGAFLSRGSSIEDKIMDITRILPRGGGIVELSDFSSYPCRKTIITVYNQNSGSYEKADFDINKGQPVPSGEIIDISEYYPIDTIRTLYFKGYDKGGPQQFAGFLDIWNEFLHEKIFSKNADLVEIGENVGDLFNRYFSVKLYRKREN